MTFTGFVNQGQAKLALILALLDPGLGGLVLAGEKGSGKSTLARLSRRLLPPGTPFIEVPLNLTLEALLGDLDFAAALTTGRPVREPGLLSRAHGGVLFVDDLHLLPPELISLILAAQEQGQVMVAGAGRGGLLPTRFCVVATCTPEEGSLSPHLRDRLGLWVQMQRLSAAERLHLLRRTLQVENRPFGERGDHLLAARLWRAQAFLGSITVPEATREYLIHLCLTAQVSGHRAELVLERAARAFAAWRSSPQVLPPHVDRVLPLVLAHRQRLPAHPPPPEAGTRKGPDEPPPSGPPPAQSLEDWEFAGPAPEGYQGTLGAAPPEDRVLPPGEAFAVRRLDWRRDRLERRTAGRRTVTRHAGPGGRYVRSTSRKRGQDVALDATLRAAAPWQLLRGRQDRVLITEDDLRYKERERRMGHLVLFVVDCSGSMGARRRMTATKGAILSLLKDCYQKRDQVALIVFRRNQAEVVLPPTASVELASRRLRDLPVGGRTPLAAGLLAAYRLLLQVRRREPKRRLLLVLVSDGRANQGISELPLKEELRRLAGLLREVPLTDFLVVDTEDKSHPFRTDLALELAAGLTAPCLTLEDLQAEHLTGLVRARLQGTTAAGPFGAYPPTG